MVLFAVTYGKYRDRKENEWYLWLTEPCVANITTHCRFNDVPFYPNSQPVLDNGAKKESPSDKKKQRA